MTRVLVDTTLGDPGYAGRYPAKRSGVTNVHLEQLVEAESRDLRRC